MPNSNLARARKSGMSETKLLGLLSPAALTCWPAVAKQLTNSGVLGSVDGRLVAAYCEAFARWSAMGDDLAKMLIDLGVTSRNEIKYQSATDLSPPPEAATSPDVTPTYRRRGPNALMRRMEVQRETGLSRSTIYKRVKDGTFPAPVKLGERSVAWRVAEIEAFLESPASYNHATKHT
jgi:predicted DNA-binding transcriptional regulator AlpA